MFLNCHSFHSLRYGTPSIEELVKQAYASGSTEMVLTDINTVTGIYDFKKECEQVGIKPIGALRSARKANFFILLLQKSFQE